ncbi:hypothetical protein M501DRAFT_1011531 [Patellaria atrata CBS 101060]|uniref:Gamma interferon inducible lysosomal thiol reductase n=1 Tax=Patellaria atrata CBS 101060 TaxID=1346257 RepID=A0A9P4SBK6_9PEZI|nr:hypothetical protein M501DRAFT_1011531 [Patellaria atrata CBS 101060]
MDPKQPLVPQTSEEMGSSFQSRPSSTSRRMQRFHIAAIVFVLGLYILARRFHCDHPDSDEHGATTKVPLEVHIMSKCPDSKACLEELVVPTMANVSDKVDFTLSYIGTPTNHDDGVSCKHGQTECLGNILELCAASLYPSPKIYLGFTYCLTRKYKLIPDRDLVHDCALEHGISFDKLNDCASKDDGSFGIDLLRKSVERSAHANVSTSCTIRLNGKVRCVHDGVWKDCDKGHKVTDLVDDIEKLYKELRQTGEDFFL